MAHNESNIVFPQRVQRRFIQLYKELPCLWDRKCLTYKHKGSRQQAVDRLTELVQEYDKSATRVHVLRKIESLRACMRREYKKVINSGRKANGEYVHVPNLWYYKQLSFVFGDSVAKHEMPEPENEPEEEEMDRIEFITDDSYENHEVDSYSELRSSDEIHSPSQKFNDDKGKRLCTEVEDEYDAIGVNVAAKLRGLRPEMRILAEKLINDVLFQAQMNGLNSSTSLRNQDSLK
ncbi:unnamed protein product [Leptidea sinapis]|uniref:MADF domain-containing protein n=1 Tax=Leptidea sinapis TaxID=189913 RepID=A0A5E4QRG9_9NEOP|nr:unnamed protein product [Leptidea sinapis]